MSGTVNVHGWALDNKGVTAVDLLIDGTTTVPLTYGSARPDVPAVWPRYPGGGDVGYAGSFDTSGLTACPHLIEIRATDTDGNQRIIARRRIYVSP